MLDFLYTIFIYPVYMFVEFILFIANNITQDHIGLSIIILSLGINLITLPIYNVAEKWQEMERIIQKRMKPKVNDIKAVFKGDERYMILSAYYRQNNYHPLYALRSLFALFIQIPFFIAAYQLLSELPALKETSFLFLKDLGSPDKLINIGSVSLNLLPVIMTVINIAASAVYTKGLELKDKLTLYLTAFLFLILLYNSPSGLVLYWTLNNIFSLFKNIFYRVKLNAKIWYFITLLFFIISTIVAAVFLEKRKPFLIMSGFTFALIIIPVFVFLLHLLDKKYSYSIFNNQEKRNKIFSFTLLSFLLLIGIVIPSGLIASSVQEFSNIDNITNPFYIIYTSFIQSVGIAFWIICIYAIFNQIVKKYITYTLVILLIFSLVNSFIFNGNYGYISNMLVFEHIEKLHSSYKDIFLNFGFLFILLIIIFIMMFKKSNFFIPFTIITTISLFLLSLINCVNIQKETGNLLQLNKIEKSMSSTKTYTFTRSGKNILFIMLDRAMNFFIDPIFDNSELIKNEYSGFVLYKNIVSFGTGTNTSTPSLYGGYEYTPEKINQRSNELLVDKHNEALCVLPRLFSEHNWSVSFTDASWANYSWLPDNSIFKKYLITARNITETGKYTEKWIHDNISKNEDKNSNIILRNMLYFSFFRISPLEVRRLIYDSGGYGSVLIPQYFDRGFINSLSALENLEKEVKFDDTINCVNIIVNNTAHDLPKLTDHLSINRPEIIELAKKYCQNDFTITSFYGNFLGHENIAKFLLFLKENNCYDNTRIVIAGDHGAGGIKMNNMKFLKNFESSPFSPAASIPLLMVKDFDSHGDLRIDSTFRTLADIPYILTENLPDIPQLNPFTGHAFLNSTNLKTFKILINSDGYANRQKKLTQFVLNQNDWAFVKDDVYKPENWSHTEFK